MLLNCSATNEVIYFTPKFNQYQHRYMLKHLFKIGTLVLFMFMAGCNEKDPTPSDKQKGPVQEEEEIEEEEEGTKPTNVPPVERYGQLSVDGNRIVDKDGNPIQLAGMSFFWSQWIGKYYTPEAVKWLKNDWRCTAVRAAMAVGHDGYLANPEVEKQKVKTVVDAAIEEGLYVLIDWHDHEGENHLEEAKAFFGEMAQLYGDYPNVIYEPYNEPLQDASWSSVLKPYHQAIIDTIRFHDPDNIVVCGTRTWSQNVDEPANDPLDDENVAYTLHFYAATHKQWLRDRAKAAMDKGIALMVTEFGTTEASGDGFIDKAEMRLWWDFMAENNISWCNWSIADKQEASAALMPGADPKGGWADNMISESGHLVRDEIIKHNPPPED